MSKHTPGPWMQDESTRIEGAGTYRHIHQSGFGGDIVGRVCVSHTLNADVNKCGEANARLIAAAPDLLEALKNIAEMNPALPMGMIEAVHAAIAKAEGETA